MSDGRIKVEFAAIEAAGGQIKSAAGQMDGELDTLRSQLAPLGEAYTGAAKEAWRAVQDDWEKAQKELNEVLASIGIATTQAAQDYQETEHGVKGLWG
nr:WXG100 family type VII secretion target [Kibdelosporangium sp. MJ126-NF4]CEL23650.1 protein of unknown function DUF909 [Kibdelosporangium sp. MJ126-NF4]CTQ93186.1 protein of unknown function DUF909 [Kibdelosporangium sp. MJ126-NF4]